MAIIPVAYKLSFYDPSKPGGVITIQENNANSATSLATQFSMQDIIDTVSATGGSIDGSGAQYALAVFTDTNTITNLPLGSAGELLASGGAGVDPSWTSSPPLKTRYLLTGMVNNMASSGGGGTDFMEWTSNVAPSTQIPLFRAPIPLKLVRLSYVWMGDAALSIAVGEEVAFTIGTVADNTDPAIGNYVSSGAVFTIDNSDDGTWAFNDVPLAITFGTGDNIGIVGTETGTVTPNDGELSISMVFEEV